MLLFLSKMHKQSKNWPGVQYPLNTGKTEFSKHVWYLKESPEFTINYSSIYLYPHWTCQWYLHQLSYQTWRIHNTWSNPVGCSCVFPGTRHGTKPVKTRLGISLHCCLWRQTLMTRIRRFSVGSSWFQEVPVTNKKVMIGRYIRSKTRWQGESW